MRLTFSQKVMAFCQVNYKLIPRDKIKPAEFNMANRSCHYNAVAAVNAGRADKVFLCISNGVVHFINYKDGKYFDETWPYADGGRDYFIIREVNKSEFDEDLIYELLCQTKRIFINMFGGIIIKIKCNYFNRVHSMGI